jgi:hypothetical protein
LSANSSASACIAPPVNEAREPAISLMERQPTPQPELFYARPVQY